MSGPNEAARMDVPSNCPEIPEGSFSSQPVVDNSARRYLGELAAEIVASGNPHGDLIEEMKAAHARRQAFSMEMANGSTDRAQKARHVIAASVYGQAIARDAIRRTFDNMEAAERWERARCAGAQP